MAETLAKAKNTSIERLVAAGMVEAKRGTVRLLAPNDLPPRWDPSGDDRVTHWEAVHHLIRGLNDGGERAAATLVAKLGGRADGVRDLAYRLYSICDLPDRTGLAVAYNTLVRCWSEITRLAMAGY
jgi:putative DNA methylase